MTQSVSVLDAELFYSRPLATPPMPVTINHPILILPLTQLMTCIMYYYAHIGLLLVSAVVVLSYLLACTKLSLCW